MKDRANRNITRVESQPGKRVVKGWEVRIQRRGERFNRFFSDSTHGGKRKALEKARECRDEQEAKYPVFTRQEIADRTSSRNSSGVRGVRFRITTVKKAGRTYTYEHAEAAWSPEPGKVIKKTFPVATYGREKAWDMAVSARREALAKL